MPLFITLSLHWKDQFNLTSYFKYNLICDLDYCKSN